MDDDRSPHIWPEKRAWSILGLRYGFAANAEGLIGAAEYFEPGEIYSQFTNWETLEPIPFDLGLDATCTLRQDPQLPLAISVQPGTLSVQGDLARLEREVQDRRWALLGNQGLWFRFALATQERHGLFAFHAASLYLPERNELVILPGKAGSGKSVVLLAALERGLQVFSTEMTYFRFDASHLSCYRGSLIDNIFVGSLQVDFPGVADRLGVHLPRGADPWSRKVTVQMQPVSTSFAILEDPAISFLFPHVERGLDRISIRDLGDARQVRRMLFENASEKIAATILLHETLPAVGLDSEQLAWARLQAVEQLLTPGSWEIRLVRAVSSGPHNCLEGLEI